MPRYKLYNLDQTKLLPINFRNQILPGTFEYTLHTVISEKIDLSVFDERFNNDETGAPAYDPTILLKIVLYAYSRGIISSREIARACRDNVVFMALSADTQPHFTTIASFISTCDDAMISVFRDVLVIADSLGLISKDMFAIDGCKLSSNASKEWSGTLKEMRDKQQKLEGAIANMLKRHRDEDALPQSDVQHERDLKQITKLQSQIDKYEAFLANHEEKLGASGKPVKSNVTDKDSAKMKTAKGVIQGYVGIAAADNKHQIIVAANAEGVAQEQQTLPSIVNAMKTNLRMLTDDEAEKANPLKDIKITADSGFHSETNLQRLAEEKTDAYMADNLFRKRDPRFADADKYKGTINERHPKITRKTFTTNDFIFDGKGTCYCPANQRLECQFRDKPRDHYRVTGFRGKPEQCGNCHLRTKCLRDPTQKSPRSVNFMTPENTLADGTPNQTQRMKQKIDSDEGRRIYSERLGTIEPVFGHIQNMGMTRFLLRGKEKVNIQWLMYCTVHNVKKLYSGASWPTEWAKVKIILKSAR